MNDSSDTQVQGDDEREDSRRLSIEGNQPPAEIEGYTVVRRLGTGAYGTVWLAREDHTGRMVAIKYFPQRTGLNWSLLTREVQKLATLYTSRNIVRLLDVGWSADPPYYVMEFVENGSLGERLSRGPLDVNESVRITREVCLALIEAHGAGVLHCDLKPDNVLLDAQLQVRLCDFGQSRMSHERSPALGTLYYMAPEQADLDAVADARWDVYAVGAILYHMLTGQPPYRTPEIQQQLESAESLADRLSIYRATLRSAPRPTGHRRIRGVDSRLVSVIDSCLTADPGERLPNSQAILAELEARERNRARRPLLLLGILGPILLIAAMVPIFQNALRSNLERMEDGITERALESDLQMAASRAEALQMELENRLIELQRMITATEIGEQLKILTTVSADELAEQTARSHDQPISQRPKWIQLLDRAHEESDATNSRFNREADTSWFLQNAAGVQVWRQPFNDKTIGKNYSFRSYFNREGVEYPEHAVPDDIGPIESPRVSLAFRSEATNRYMVVLAIPVRDEDERIIGVLGRSIHLGELQNRLGQRLHGIQERVIERVIALADQRTGQLLDHPWLTSDHIQADDPNLDALFARLKIPVAISQPQPRPGINATTGTIQKNYVDPVGRLDNPSTAEYTGEWMAAMVPMESPQTPWLVIVQEKRDDALRPVADMTRNAKRTAWIAVATSMTLMGIVWLFVWRAFQKSGTPLPFRRP